MKKWSKIRYIFMGAIAMLFAYSAITPAMAESITKQINAVYCGIKVLVDGKEVKLTNANGEVTEPIIIDGTVYMPVNNISSALGKTYEWDSVNNVVHIGQKPGVTTSKPAYYMLDVVPAYQSSYDGNNDAGDKYQEFQASLNGNTGNGFFEMGGEKYINGAYWYADKNVYSVGASYNDSASSYSLYNLNKKYEKAYATVGHLDGAGTSSAIMNFYADGNLIREINLTADTPLANIVIELLGVSQLKIELVPVMDNSGVRGENADYSGSCKYGLGNLIIQ